MKTYKKDSAYEYAKSNLDYYKGTNSKNSGDVCVICEDGSKVVLDNVYKVYGFFVNRTLLGVDNNGCLSFDDSFSISDLSCGISVVKGKSEQDCKNLARFFVKNGFRSGFDIVKTEVHFEKFLRMMDEFENLASAEVKNGE